MMAVSYTPQAQLSRFFFLFLLASSFLCADEPIFVRLATETERLPLYLAHVDGTRSGFDPGYCAKLEKILQFDLDHNGMTYLATPSPELEKRLAASFDQLPKETDWKSAKAFYIVKVRVKDQALSARLFAVNSESAKSIDGIPLSGDLSSDRRQIHQLADTIHKALFATEGIASTRLLYTLRTKNPAASGGWDSEVWESDYDGHNPRRLTRESGYSVTPLYIPPKQGYTAGTFLFVAYKTGQPKIYYQTTHEDESPHRLTYMRGNQLMPVVSRQRDKLAFISDITGNPDLFILPFSPETGATGKPYQIFSAYRATQGTPTFSPDGKRIAFVSNKDGSPRIYVMDVPEAGTSVKDVKAVLLTKRNRESSAPAWSPDGTKIAYCSRTDQVRQIWVYDFTTREERQLTQGPGHKENPSWAPNSLHLVFNSVGPDSCELYLINLHQAEATKITAGPGEKRFPNWEPRGLPNTSEEFITQEHARHR